MLDNYFNYKKHKTDFKTGFSRVSTFLTMAYIMFLNPVILADGGFDFGGVFTATACATALACLYALLCKDLASRTCTRYGNKCIYCIRCLSRNGIPPAEALGAVLVAGGVLNYFTYTNKSLVN